MSTSTTFSREKGISRVSRATRLVLCIVVTLALALLTWIFNEMAHLDTINNYVALRNWLAAVTLLSLYPFFGVFRKYRLKS